MTQQTVAAPAPARPSRRSVAAGLAWAVPVIAVGAAAPRAAASPCNPQHYVLDWSEGTGTSYTRNSSSSGTAVVDPDGAGPIAAVTLSISSVFTGSMASGNETRGQTNQNYRVSSSQVGGLGAPGLQFEQVQTNSLNSTPPQRSARQAVTFSFSEPVANLAFTMTDIDAVAGDFADMVELTGGFTYQHVTNRTTGSGTVAAPFKNTQNGDVSTSQNFGNVRIVYPGPVSSFTMTYWNSVTSYSGADRNQIVSFGNFEFDVLRNTC